MAVLIKWDTQRDGGLPGQTTTSSTTAAADGTPPASTGEMGTRQDARIPRSGGSVKGGQTEFDAATSDTVDDVEKRDAADSVRQAQHAAALIGHLTVRHLHDFLFGESGVRDVNTDSAAATLSTTAAEAESTWKSSQGSTTHSQDLHWVENRTPSSVAPAPQTTHVVGGPRDMAGENRRQMHCYPRRSEAAARAALAGGGYCVLQKFIQSVGASHSTLRCQWVPPRPSRSSHDPDDGEGKDRNRRPGGGFSHPPDGGSLASRVANRIRQSDFDDGRVRICGPRGGNRSSGQGAQTFSARCQPLPSPPSHDADSGECVGEKNRRKSGVVGASLSRPEGTSACRGGHRVYGGQDEGQVRQDGVLGGSSQNQPGVSSSGGYGLLGLGPACETTENDRQEDGGEQMQFCPKHVCSSSQSLARKRSLEFSRDHSPTCSRIPERPLDEPNRRTRRTLLRPSPSSYVEHKFASSPQGRSTSSTPALSTGRGERTVETTTSRGAAMEVRHISQAKTTRDRCSRNGSTPSPSPAPPGLFALPSVGHSTKWLRNVPNLYLYSHLILCLLGG